MKNTRIYKSGPAWHLPWHHYVFSALASKLGGLIILRINCSPAGVWIQDVKHSGEIHKLHSNSVNFCVLVEISPSWGSRPCMHRHRVLKTKIRKLMNHWETIKWATLVSTYFLAICTLHCEITILDKILRFNKILLHLQLKSWFSLLLLVVVKFYLFKNIPTF